MESKNIYIVGDKDFLMHHGIKGQKWGVENGPPYPLDPQKDYSKAEQKANAKALAKEYKKDVFASNKINIKNVDLSDDEKINDYINKVIGEYGNIKVNNSYYGKLIDKVKLDIDNQLREINNEKQKQELKELAKKNKIEDQDLLTTSKFKNDIKRTNEAADLGLKALNKMGRHGFDPERSITSNDREWFLYEDQTIGLGMIADLVNQGKSKNEIKSMLSQALDSDDEYYNDSYFNFIEGSGYDIDGFDKFIDACIEIKNN